MASRSLFNMDNMDNMEMEVEMEKEKENRLSRHTVKFDGGGEVKTFEVKIE